MSNTLSDPFLFFAFWTGIGALALTLLLGLQIVYLRGALRRQESLERAVVATWRPLLSAAIADVPPDELPALVRREQLPFLKLWVHLHHSLRGDASTALNAMGIRLGCDAIARTLMRDGSRAQRLLAVMVLGHLRNAASWDELEREAMRADSTISIHALWALVQIDALRAAGLMTPLLLRREDWALSQLAAILQEARDAFAPVLADAMSKPAAEHLGRALQLADALRVAPPAPLLARLLRDPTPEIVAGALRLVATPALLEETRACLNHEHWQVRVQAVRALGRLGDRSDVDRLRQRLRDPQWWVRYRAAQALAELPFLAPSDLERLCAEIEDRYAADMVRQVMAEKELE